MADHFDESIKTLMEVTGQFFRPYFQFEGLELVPEVFGTDNVF